MKRELFHLLILFFMLPFSWPAMSLAYAQKPVITSFEPAKGWFGEEVLITGSGFSTNKADLKVKFGAVEAKILESGLSGIRVEIPSGATYAPITVTNLTSGLTAHSSRPFLLTFGGKEDETPVFDAAKQFTINPNPAAPLPRNNLVDVCACDLDGDKKIDLIGSNQVNTSASVYQNISTIGNLDFPTSRRFSFSTGKRTNFVSCGDLDGDGKADLVFTGFGTDQQSVIVLKNNSTAGTNGDPGNIYFGTYQLLTVPAKTWIKPVIHDLDGDGLPEIILTNETDATITVLKNNSEIGFISFNATPATFSVSKEMTRGLRIKDVNNDGKPDITASNYLFNNKVHFLLNNSSEGNISFQDAIEFTASNNLHNHELEDFDGDGKPDLISLDFGNNKADFYLNNSTHSTISFSTAKSVAVGSNPTGLELGDFNGDGKADVLIGLNASPMAYLLTNTSTEGSLSFSSTILSTSFGKFPNVQIADFDGDAKPDAVVADKEYNHFYIFRNKTCIAAVIHPITRGESITLSAVQSPSSANTPALSYQWYKDGAAMNLQTYPTLENIEPGVYTVEIVTYCGTFTSPPYSSSSCQEDLGNPVVESDRVVCEGGSLSLSVVPAVEGATYTWTNSNGFSRTTTSNTLSIEAATPGTHSGTYTVAIENAICSLNLQSEAVAVEAKPTASIVAEGSLTLCTGESTLLRAEQESTAYQWNKNGVAIISATAATYTATEGGTYSLTVKNNSGCQAESNSITIARKGNLQAKFDAPAAACLGYGLQFVNQSTTDPGAAASYLWDFGDGNTSTDASPMFTYSSTEGSPYTVTLTVHYQGTHCSSTVSRSISIVETPEITIEALGSTEFCSGEQLRVQVTGEIASVKWSNGDTGLFTDAKEGGILTAEVLSSAGCTVSKSIELNMLPIPVLEVSTDKSVISRGESAQLQVSGALSYTWEPAESLDYPTTASPVASPTTTTTYKVYGQGEWGCVGEAEITIEVDNSFKVTTPKLFIPATDQSWRVSNIENFPEVSLLIISKLGKTVFEATPYENNWDGTDHGKQAAEGVYFYVFKDASGNVIKTGSITLVR